MGYRRQSVWWQEASTCVYCGIALGACAKPGQRQEDNQKTRDHRIPASRGGAGSFNNLVVACRLCNEIKDDMTDQEFLHFKQTGRFAESYIRWMEEQSMKRMR